MSGEFIYENYGQPEDFQLKKTSSRKMEKGLKKILVIAAIILGAEFVWLFGVSPCIPFSVVNVKGFPGFEKDAILICFVERCRCGKKTRRTLSC